MARKAKGVTAPPTGDTDGMMGRAMGTVELALRTLHTCITKLSEVIANGEDYDKGLVSHLAWLTNQVNSIMKELRQQQKLERSLHFQLTDERVLAWLRDLPLARRSHVLRLANAIDSGKSGLA